MLDVKVGDKVTRLMAGTIEMELTVTAVDEQLIHCASWTFDRASGAEVDEDLRWGPSHGVTGSYITAVNGKPVGAGANPSK